MPIERLQIGDRLLMRRHEVVPPMRAARGTPRRSITRSSPASRPRSLVRAGDTVRAGGRVLDRAVRLRLLEEASHSQLAKFWSEQVDGRAKEYWLTAVASRFGKWFTVAAVGIAAAGARGVVAGRHREPDRRHSSAHRGLPLRDHVLGADHPRHGDGPARHPGALSEAPRHRPDLSRIDTVAFDKTGTLTTAGQRTTV